jgi:hypothetical protein
LWSKVETNYQKLTLEFLVAFEGVAGVEAALLAISGSSKETGGGVKFVARPRTYKCITCGLEASWETILWKI